MKSVQSVLNASLPKCHLRNRCLGRKFSAYFCADIEAYTIILGVHELLKKSV